MVHRVTYSVKLTVLIYKDVLLAVLDLDDEYSMILTKEDANNGNYYKIKNILAFDDDRALLRELIKAGYEEIIQNDLCRLFARIHSSGSDGIVHYYCISENTYDEALDIFVRVNSTGRKLSKSDLLFSTLIDGWKEGKDRARSLL